MTLTIIKLPRESTYRELLNLIESIRYHKLYDHLDYLQSLTNKIPKTKVIKP